MKGFIKDTAAADALVYTDDHGSYQGIPYRHETVKHSVGEYVKNQVHTNGIESFWALLKRGYYGTYHKMSRKHLSRYVSEFKGLPRSRVLLDTRLIHDSWRKGCRDERTKARGGFGGGRP